LLAAVLADETADLQLLPVARTSSMAAVLHSPRFFHEASPSKIRSWLGEFLSSKNGL
jgi:hypothetical protein